MLNITFPSIVFTIINILVFAWIMKKFLFQRVLDVIDERQKNIQAQFNEAKAREDAADSKKAEYEAHIRDVKLESEKILEESRVKAESERQNLLEETQVKISYMKKKAEEDMRIESVNAKKNLQADIARLAIQAAHKIMTEGQEANEGTSN